MRQNPNGGYAALSLPVLGLGIALPYLCPQVTLLIFALAVGLGILAAAPTPSASRHGPWTNRSGGLEAPQTRAATRPFHGHAASLNERTRRAAGLARSGLTRSHGCSSVPSAPTFLVARIGGRPGHRSICFFGVIRNTRPMGRLGRGRGQPCDGVKPSDP
jgi:hypothetical protein